jgi:hypothetical protein
MELSITFIISTEEPDVITALLLRCKDLLNVAARGLEADEAVSRQSWRLLRSARNDILATEHCLVIIFDSLEAIESYLHRISN